MAAERPTLIAIVDDEPAVRRSLVRLLRSAGMQAREFAGGAEFLESLSCCRYDCLVLDLHMPGLSGLEVQQDRAFIETGIPAVIISAYDEPESRLKCLAAGAACYLVKPFDDDALLQTVGKAMGVRPRLP